MKESRTFYVWQEEVFAENGGFATTVNSVSLQVALPKASARER
jgi:hypothetical protein